MELEAQRAQTLLQQRPGRGSALGSAALFCDGAAVKVEAETSGCDEDWPRAPEVTGKYFK